MKKFFALFSLLFFSLFFPASLISASAPEFEHDDELGDHENQVVCSIPISQLQIIYLRRPAPAAEKLEQPDLEDKEDKEEEKFGPEQHHRKHRSHHRSLSSNSSYVLELQRMMADPDLIQVICPYCTEVQMVPGNAHVECVACGYAFASPEIPACANRRSSNYEFGDQEWNPNLMPDYAPLTAQELAQLNIVSTKPVRQSLGMRDCAVHALANALAINTELAKQAQNLDIKKLVNPKTHDLYYAQIENACEHNTYNVPSDIIQKALGTLKRENHGTPNQHIFTNIFVVDNVGELPLLESIRSAMANLPTQPDQDPRGAIHFICNTRPYYGDPAQLHGHQAGKHWVTLSLIKQKGHISFYFSDSNHGNIPTTLHPLIRILAERYNIIAPNSNPQYQPPQEQSSALASLFKWLLGY